MKLVTTYAALELLGPAYRWKTEVYLDGNDLVLKGYGDPEAQLGELLDAAAQLCAGAGCARSAATWCSTAASSRR